MININGSIMKGAILDMDGVLWKAKNPLCDLPQLFDNFVKNQIQVVLATNNGTQSISEYIEKLSGFNVRLEPRQVITSPMAAAYLTKKYFPNGGPVYISGSKALSDIMVEFGFFHSEKEPQAVVAGLSLEFNYESIKKTSLMIQKGMPFIFTNPDPTYPTPEGNVPGAGTVLAALEAASGVKGMLAGKPQPFLFEVALERMKLSSEEVFVVGDRLSTDIIGGSEAGCKTVFVLTGVNTREDLENWEPKPNLVLDNISDLFK